MLLPTKRKLTPLPLTRVTVEDSFWASRIRVNHEQTLPHEYKQCKDTGRIDAFLLNWEPGMQPKPHYFWDSDVAKWIEAAGYALAVRPDPELDALLDQVIEKNRWRPAGRWLSEYLLHGCRAAKSLGKSGSLA